ncbi:MAG: hypothetical protein J6C37_01995 [Roseburia sp.]|nr:hypothetical protein [Roseburia sp.]
MKKIKFILPILTAAVLLFPGMQVKAATTQKEFASGTKNATLTMTLDDLQSFEAKINAKEKEGGTITLQSVEAKSSDANAVEVGASDNKVFMVSNGTSVSATVTIKVAFSGDGTYWVTLKGGSTNRDGAYSSDNLDERIKIIVGSTTTTGTEEDDKEDDVLTPPTEVKGEVSNTTSTQTGSSSADSTTSTQENTKTDESATSTKVSLSVEEDSSTEDDSTIIRNDTTIEDEESLRVIDQIIKEAEEKTEDKTDNKTGKSSFKLFEALRNYLKYILLIMLIALLLLIPLVVYLLWKAKKKKQETYDGAPMVDYRIEEDDD